jgi:hypothetical protein
MKSIVDRGSLPMFLAFAAGLGCSSSPTPAGGEGAGTSSATAGSGGVLGSSGAAETGGSVASGGATSVGGAKGSGGISSSGAASGQGGAVQGSGGVGATAGTQAAAGDTSGGATATGGTATGGTATGGTPATGGTSSVAVSIFDGKTLNGWSVAHNAGANSFSVNVADQAIASTGGVRASLYYSQNEYSFYRVIYTERQVIRKGHDPGVLFFGTHPTEDALWGVMFALPDNWGWDYRNGVSQAAATGVGKVPNLDLTQWTRCELLVNSATGLARAACAQPVGTKAIEVLKFQDSKTPNVPSYFGILCHTAGEDDEYKDITLEANPAVNDLITTK